MTEFTSTAIVIAGYFCATGEPAQHHAHNGSILTVTEVCADGTAAKLIQLDVLRAEDCISTDCPIKQVARLTIDGEVIGSILPGDVPAAAFRALIDAVGHTFDMGKEPKK